MEQTTNVNPETIKAFDMMWGAFPTPVMLIHKNRTIVAVNKLAADYGIKTGIKCYALTGETKMHGYCLGNQALSENAAKHSVGYLDLLKRVQDSYWVPVQGEKDLFVHFAVDLTEYAKPELFPADK